MLMNKSIQKQTGFTLAELMITVAIAAILLAVGMPSMRDFIKNSRITAVTNEMVSTLMVARSEAMRASGMSCVCPAVDGDNDGAVDLACVASNNWETGWIAFSDANGNCVMDQASDVLLKVWDGASYAGSITVRNNDGTINGLNAIRFNSRGETQTNVAGVGLGGTFSICDDRPMVADANGKVTMAAGVTLGLAGSARSTRQAAQLTYTAP